MIHVAMLVTHTSSFCRRENVEDSAPHFRDNNPGELHANHE